MSSLIESGVWRSVATSEWGGLPEHLRAAARDGGALPTAGDFVPPSAMEPVGGGPAWADDRLQEELRRAHVRMGADPTSLQSLDVLASGAACVITGQQPGFLGGPLYTAWKVSGTLAIAGELGRCWGRPVVPVFWCASDDSDFDEVAQAWWAAPGRAPSRLHLPRREHREGQMVGGLDAATVAEHEAGMLPEARALPGVRDWGELFGSRLLQRFSGRGLVVLDARSERLRERGRDLFLDYASRAESVATILDERRSELRQRGWPSALAARSRESGLFLVEDGRRRRWVPGGSITARDVLSPSVILRALWQDRELGPAAVVLGPGEFSYHAQIAPLYGYFGVRAPATLPRPHGVLLPPGLDGQDLDEILGALVSDPERCRRALTAAGADPAVERAWREAREASLGVTERLERSLEGAAAEVIRRLRWRQEREWDRARRALHARTGRDWREELAWLWPQDRAQERTLAQAVLDRFFAPGPEFWGPFERGHLEALERRTWYAAAYSSGDGHDRDL